MKTYKFKDEVTLDDEIKFDKVKKIKGAITHLQTHHGDGYVRLKTTNVMVPDCYLDETEPDPEPPPEIK